MRFCQEPVSLRYPYFVVRRIIGAHLAKAKLGCSMFECNLGANIEATNSRLQTPLHTAAEKGQEKVVELLLDAGNWFIVVCVLPM